MTDDDMRDAVSQLRTQVWELDQYLSPFRPTRVEQFEWVEAKALSCAALARIVANELQRRK